MSCIVSGRARRALERAAVGLGLLALVAVTAPAVAASTAPNPVAAAAAPVVGIQDSSINGCNQHEALSFANAAPDYPRARMSLADMRARKTLNVQDLRFSPPWDVADHPAKNKNGIGDKPMGMAILNKDQACLNYWLALVHQTGRQVQIAFKPDYNYTDASGRSIVPEIGTYRKAIDEFIAEYANCGGASGGCPVFAVVGTPGYPGDQGNVMAVVRVISPWGEPDLPIPHLHMPQGPHIFGDWNCARPIRGFKLDQTCGPVLAAQMWVAVHDRCGPRCTVVAGDFSSNIDSGSRDPYVAEYVGALGRLRSAVQVWGIHPYTDVEDFEIALVGGTPPKPLKSTRLGRFASDLHSLGYGNHTQIWLNEISAYQGHNMRGQPQPWSPKVQGEATSELIHRLTLAGGRSPQTAAEPVVTRLYYLAYADAIPTDLIPGGPNSRITRDGRLVCGQKMALCPASPPYEVIAAYNRHR